MMTGQQGIPSPRTLAATAELAGRLRLVLGEEDAAAAVEIIAAAGWRPAPTDGPISDLVTGKDLTVAMDAYDADSYEAAERDPMGAALESYGPRLLARHGRGGP